MFWKLLRLVSVLLMVGCVGDDPNWSTTLFHQLYVDSVPTVLIGLSWILGWIVPAVMIGESTQNTVIGFIVWSVGVGTVFYMGWWYFPILIPIVGVVIVFLSVIGLVDGEPIGGIIGLFFAHFMVIASYQYFMYPEKFEEGYAPYKVVVESDQSNDNDTMYNVVKIKSSAQEKKPAPIKEYPPPIQLKKLKRQRTQIEERIDSKLQPLLQQYQQDFEEIQEKIKEVMKDAKIKSHEQLLRSDNTLLKNYFERIAILKFNTNWLQTNIGDLQEKVLALDQAEWKIQRYIEMQSVSTPEEMEEIMSLSVNAQAVLEATIPVPDKQDLAEIEASLFNALK